MRKIEKTITRDLQFVDIEAWYSGYMTGLKKWLGWGYTDTLFHIHDGHVDMMRIPEEHLVVFRDKVLEKIQNNPDWFITEGKNTENLVKEIYDFFAKSKVEVKQTDNKELNELYLKYSDYVERIMGPFIMAYWLPNWFEKDEVYSKKFDKEIVLSMNQRKMMEQIFPQGAQFIDELMKKVSEQIKFESGLERFISAKELSVYLLDNISPSVEIISKRKLGFIFSKDGISFTDNTSSDLKKVLTSLGYEIDLFEKNDDIKEIKGQSACKGVFTGKVRVILNKTSISSLEEGEILVTAMTTPEYVPAMKRSAAFITDEGGVTCHAAIIARELNKPCIIGTKIATQVLKDGDMVEVDADNGVIKIIK